MIRAFIHETNYFNEVWYLFNALTAIKMQVISAFGARYMKFTWQLTC